MQIDKHGRLAGVAWKPARAVGAPLERVRAIVAHDTAGLCGNGSSVRWFQDPACTVSAHFVIDREGRVTQCVSLNNRAMHAGESVWTFQAGDTVRYLNSCTIGIELENPGRLIRSGDACHLIYPGNKVVQSWPVAECMEMETLEHGRGWWLPYSEAQIASLILVATFLTEHFADCNEIIGHWQISPGRKVDPNPLFPWQRVVDSVLTPSAAPDAKPEAPPALPLPAPVDQKSGITETAAVTGGVSTTQLGIDAASAMSKLNGAKKPWHIGDMLIELAQRPTFWLALTAVVGAAFVMFKRLQQKRSA